MALVIANNHNEHEFKSKLPKDYLLGYNRWISGRPLKDEVVTIYARDNKTLQLYYAKVVEVNGKWHKTKWKPYEG